MIETWPQAVTIIAVTCAFVFLMAVAITERWPWEKGGKNE